MKRHMETQGADPLTSQVWSKTSDAQALMPSATTIGPEVLEGLRVDIMGFHNQTAREGGHDITGIVGAVRKFFSGIREGAWPVNSEAASPVEVSLFLSEVGRCVFLPRHEVIDVRLLGERYEIVNGKLDPRSYKALPYLGREIRTADVSFTHGVENSMGLSIGTLAMVDPQLIRRDCNLFLEQLPMLSQMNGFARELSRFITDNRISRQEYYKVAGLERLLMEEVQHAKDAIFIRLITKQEDSLERREDVLLRPGSKLHQMVRHDTSTSMLGSVAISEYSSSMGGLVMELDQYVARKQYSAVKLAVLDFLTQQASRAMPPREDAIAVIYHMGARAVFEGLREAMPDVQSPEGMVTRLFAGATPQQQAQRCRKIFAELLYKDFWTDWERKNLVAHRP